MKFDQNLCKTLEYDLKKLLWQEHSSRGSVVPLAMFSFYLIIITSGYAVIFDIRRNNSYRRPSETEIKIVQFERKRMIIMIINSDRNTD